MAVSIRERIGKVGKKRIVAVIIVVLLVLAVPLWILLQPKSTPDFVQSRGVKWHVFLEEPIQFDEVKSIITVFVSQVDTLFKIRTDSILYEYLEDDGVDDYSRSEDSRRRLPAPESGPVEVPIYFLTGFGSGSEFGWGERNPQHFIWTIDLWFKIVIPSRGRDHYLTGNSDTLITLLHEFGHNMGLKDLREGGDVTGCSHLRVIMGNKVMNLTLEKDEEYSHPQYEDPLINRTWTIEIMDEGQPSVLFLVEEVYFENNILHFISYSMDVQGRVHLAGLEAHLADLEQLRGMWTKEEAAFISMEGEFELLCPQEFGNG
jgi:hypothetical protein